MRVSPIRFLLNLVVLYVLRIFNADGKFHLRKSFLLKLLIVASPTLLIDRICTFKYLQGVIQVHSLQFFALGCCINKHIVPGLRLTQLFLSRLQTLWLFQIHFLYLVNDRSSLMLERIGVIIARVIQAKVLSTSKVTVHSSNSKGRCHQILVHIRPNIRLAA